jgi:hypothetical protein
VPAVAPRRASEAPPAVEEEDASVAVVAVRPPSGLRVVRTSWHPHADRRAAWVELGGSEAREVREGEQLGVWLVREIEPGGVVFADGMVELRRSVGER